MSQSCPSSGQANAQVLTALLAELDALGITEYCVAAGARNAPLLAVLLARAESHGLTVRHFFEERCASFFALGRVMATQRPVAVVTTSGTAVAELLPAVMEAHYQAAPLVVVTADRPSQYRGSGAPQAVEQPGIFGTYVVRTVELEASTLRGLVHEESVAPLIGPIHFNVCLEEVLAANLIPTVRPAAPPYLPAETLTGDEQEAWRQFFAAPGNLAVVASGIAPADVPAAVALLTRLQAPIVAEATSNLLSEPALQPWLLPPSERTLKELSPQRVLRLGAVPSWRWWRDLEDRPDVAVLNVSRAPFRGLARTEQVHTLPWIALSAAPSADADTTLAASTTPFTPQEFEGQRERLEAQSRLLPHAEPSWMRHLSRIIRPRATVFLGNSLPIREWNLAADLPRPGTRFYANRGANGIDGLVSTWLGLSSETSSSTPTATTTPEESWLIIGDLSTLYDLSAPWILQQLPPAPRRIVIINNGGGKIFSRVAWLKNAGPAARAVMENSHTLSFAPWAQMWGLEYQLITTLKELEDAQASADAASCTVWEIRPDAEETAEFWKNSV